MTRKSFLWIVPVIAFLVIFGFIGGTKEFLWAMNLTEEIKVKEYNPKIEGVLEILAEKYRENKVTAQDFAHQNKIRLEDNRVTVILVPPVGEDASVIDQTSLIFYQATVEAISRHLIRVSAPVSALDEIADRVRGISYIRRPLVPVAADFWISEGVAKTGAYIYHDVGYKGRGVKVAVIDTGFLVWEEALGEGQLGSRIVTKDFTGEGVETGTRHGTKVAEVVHDMAPQATLYLIKILDELDLEKAKDYCIDEKVKIINHSHTWANTNYNDGTGIIDEIANDARAQGILWVNAAGNYAQQHYEGLFTDTDGDDWHEFSTSSIDETNQIENVSPGGSLEVYLTWNSWPETNQDYDLYLLDGGGNIVARSENRQTGNQPPTEEIRISEASGSYYIAVKAFSTTGPHGIEIHAFHQLQYSTHAGSILAPADAAKVMTVGAIDQANWDTGPQEPYSSQGPTEDGRIKPDICGPTKVTTYAGGPKHFEGTSAAAPHVAGAAALLLSRNHTYTPAQLQETLEYWAVDMGEAGKDNIYGSGKLRILPRAAPVLSWTGETSYVSDGLHPEVGNYSTDFTYRVKYSDADNDAPGVRYPSVHILKGGSEIAGSPFIMVEVDPDDTNYLDGKLYTFSKKNMPEGDDHTYYFNALDVLGNLPVGEPTSPKEGPLVQTTPPQISWVTYPSSIVTGESFTVEVTFTWEGSDDTTPSEDLVYSYFVSGYDTGWSSWSSQTTKNYVLPRGTYKFGVKCKDAIGNISLLEWEFTVSLPIFPYPNPRRDSSQLIRIANISPGPNTKVYIYSVSGQLVRTLQGSDIEMDTHSNVAVWDGRNYKGEDVSGGVYIYRVTGDQGQEKIGTIAIIK